MLVSMASGVLNESILREISLQGVSPVFLLFLRQTVYTIISLIFMLRTMSLRTKYLGLHMFRGVAFSLGAICWSSAITMNSSAIPLYLVYYTALCVPIFNTILSRILLKESPGKVMTYLFIASTFPILFYIISGAYAQQILLLCLACFIYSSLDCVNTYINLKNPRKDSLMSRIIPHEGKEPLAINNFYNAFVINIVYLVSALSQNVASQWVIISKSPETMLKIGLMGLLSSIIFPVMMLALKFSNLSSLQPLKIFEPILAARAFDHKDVPAPILVGIATFFAGSIFGIIRRVFA